MADSTRPATLEAALDLQRQVREAIGNVPFVLVLNKADLTADWEIADHTITDLAQTWWTWLKASAKSGVGVEEAFRTLIGKRVEA